MSLALATILSLAAAPTVSAASDVSGPVLHSPTVSPTSLSIATGPATVKVRLRLTDATGANAPTLTASHDITGQSHGFGSMTLISGTTQDGTWERSITIPQGSATGAWAVRLFPLGDTLGNRSTGFQTLATLTVTAVAVSPSLTAAPAAKITGTFKVGYTLTAGPGTWSPAPVTLTYQWYRSGIAITGATASTYKLTAPDAGTALTVRITGRQTGYLAISRTSAATTSVSR
jgi:serine protease